METLINTSVRFSISEPEDFYFNNGEGPFDGVIVGYSFEVMFVKVRSVLQYNSKQLRYFAVVMRHEGESLTRLRAASHMVVNFAPLLVDDDVGDVSIDELVNQAKQFRGQHLIGDVWLAA
jgi:hypothetical protein